MTEVVRNGPPPKKPPPIKAARRNTTINTQTPGNWSISVRNKVVWDYIAGFGHQQIEERLFELNGSAPERRTISAWIDAAIQEIKVPAEKVAEARARMLGQLDVATQKVFEILAESNGELALKAIDRLVRIQDRRSKFEGLDMPQRVDHTVTEVTQADLELRDMINEAKAAADQRMREVREQFARRQDKQAS
jgi:hypothetical protein